MVTEAGKELLRNTINTAKFHNRIIEEQEMWKQWDLECGLTMMVSDDDVLKRIKKNHQCSKHRRRDKSRSRDRSRSRYEIPKTRPGAGSSNDRWDHSGFAELYPDADVSDQQPSTSVSSLDRHKKKKKKSRHRSDSSDEEIWEEFKRPAPLWNIENILRLIDRLRDAPALWNINYPGYHNQHVKLKETKRIALEFCVHEDEIMKQIAFLMNEFHKEHKRLALKNVNGACVKFSENEWFAYKHLTFLVNNKNERYCKNIKNNHNKGQNLQFVDSSDSYSDSEDETNELSVCIKSKVQDDKSNEREKKVNYTGTSLPYVQAYKAQKDSFSVYGEIVAHRLREAKRSSKALARVEDDIDFILCKFEKGFYDPPKDTL